ncbi:hypothetical protein E2C01_027443 [Portunus trituberculatus]|uniref:Uncharacterized protein n=1 Tax=Portunus trituberculatus TaxID=210409 RepID=A0A5B7ELM8_PORTR|nr:hypothetical protein [Portunus trituberculatus]
MASTRLRGQPPLTGSLVKRSYLSQRRHATRRFTDPVQQAEPDIQCDSSAAPSPKGSCWWGPLCLVGVGGASSARQCHLHLFEPIRGALGGALKTCGIAVPHILGTLGSRVRDLGGSLYSRASDGLKVTPSFHSALKYAFRMVFKYVPGGLQYVSGLVCIRLPLRVYAGFLKCVPEVIVAIPGYLQFMLVI